MCGHRPQTSPVAWLCCRLHLGSYQVDSGVHLFVAVSWWLSLLRGCTALAPACCKGLPCQAEQANTWGSALAAVSSFWLKKPRSFAVVQLCQSLCPKCPVAAFCLNWIGACSARIKSLVMGAKRMWHNKLQLCMRLRHEVGCSGPGAYLQSQRAAKEQEQGTCMSVAGDNPGWPATCPSAQGCPAGDLFESTKQNSPKLRFGTSQRDAAEKVFISADHEKSG